MEGLISLTQPSPMQPHNHIPYQGLHTCQGWGVLLLVCMHRGGYAPQGVHLVPYMSLPCPHCIGVPLRCPPGSLLTTSSFSGDHVVSIPSSQWFHKSCHTNLCARILLTFWDPFGLADHWTQTSMVSCGLSGLADHHAWTLWSLWFYLAPCMDAVGQPWLIWSCMDPGVFP